MRVANDYSFKDVRDVLKHRKIIVGLLRPDMIAKDYNGTIVLTKVPKDSGKGTLSAYIMRRGLDVEVSCTGVAPNVAIEFAKDVKNLSYITRTGVDIIKIKQDAVYYTELLQSLPECLWLDFTEGPDRIGVWVPLSERRYRITIWEHKMESDRHIGLPKEEKNINNFLTLLRGKETTID